MGKKIHTRFSLEVLFACVFLFWVACDKNEESAEAPEEDLTIVVEADRSRLLAQEKELEEKSTAVQSERDRLSKERADIAQKLSTLSKKDKKQRDQLEAEQKRLADEEKRIRTDAKKFDDERRRLDQDKNVLLERITALTKKGKGGLTIEQREEAVGQREKTLAEREAKLAEREAKIGGMEAQTVRVLEEANRLVAELRGGAGRTVVVTQAPSGGSTGSVASKTSYQKLRKQVQSKMENKGLLVDDLPPTVRGLFQQADAAADNKDYQGAEELLNQLQSAVDSRTIDRQFVDAKMARLNKEIQDTKLDEKRKKKVSSLLQELGEAFTDGRYDRANRKANQIASVLKGES